MSPIKKVKNLPLSLNEQTARRMTFLILQLLLLKRRCNLSQNRSHISNLSCETLFELLWVNQSRIQPLLNLKCQKCMISPHFCISIHLIRTLTHQTTAHRTQYFRQDLSLCIVAACLIFFTRKLIRLLKARCLQGMNLKFKRPPDSSPRTTI